MELRHPLWTGMSITAEAKEGRGTWLKSEFPIEVQIEYPWNDSIGYRVSIEEANALAGELLSAVQKARRG